MFHFDPLGRIGALFLQFLHRPRRDKFHNLLQSRLANVGHLVLTFAQSATIVDRNGIGELLQTAHHLLIDPAGIRIARFKIELRQFAKGRDQRGVGRPDRDHRRGGPALDQQGRQRLAIGLFEEQRTQAALRGGRIGGELGPQFRRQGRHDGGSRAANGVFGRDVPVRDVAQGLAALRDAVVPIGIDIQILVGVHECFFRGRGRMLVKGCVSGRLFRGTLVVAFHAALRCFVKGAVAFDEIGGRVDFQTPRATEGTMGQATIEASAINDFVEQNVLGTDEDLPIVAQHIFQFVNGFGMIDTIQRDRIRRRRHHFDDIGSRGRGSLGLLLGIARMLSALLLERLFPGRQRSRRVAPAFGRRRGRPFHGGHDFRPVRRQDTRTNSGSFLQLLLHK
jgi:hypothetical protein